MDTKTKTDTLPQLNINKDISKQLAESREKLGMLDSWNLKKRDSQRAKNDIATIEDALAESRKNMAITAINIAESHARGALVAAGVGTTAALLREVNEATTSGQQAISDTAIAESLSIYSNKNNRWIEIESLASSGKLTPNECQLTKDLAELLANDDIERSMKRAQSSKDALSAIADHATLGIEQSIDRMR